MSQNMPRERSAEYLLDLINDILTLNKIDTDNAAETDIKSVFSLEEEVRNLTLLTDERAKARKARARSLK